MSTEALTKVGSELFDQTYGDTAKTVQTILNDAYPDLCKSRKCLLITSTLISLLGFFSAAFAYGYVYSCSEVLSLADTEFAMIAALIPIDTPRQIDWHLHGAIRNGADILEVKAVRQIAIEVAQLAGVKWKNEIPDI
jgi:alkylhydroperoxidase/carboxymuconolactone decarboxylase family protein YurZ